MQPKIFLATIVLMLLCMEAASWRRRRRRRCPTHSCSWHWGACSRTCGGGTQRAIKTANQGACGSCNMPSHAQSCNTHCCRTNCQWYSWGAWGACSRNCGTGTQSRSRGQRSASCGGTACTGSATQSRSCNTQCCPVHCSWGGWSSWGSCSVRCGGGKRSRTRGHSPAASCGGNTCLGSAMESSQCNTHCCPVHCSWAAWSGWSSCTKNCGGGSQTRSRGHGTVSQCGGNVCVGKSQETRECNKHCCPQHCSWAGWSSWGVCSASCGGGSQARSRAHSVVAACGGRPCSGSSQDTRTCNANCCPVNCEWEDWAGWGACSATCGGGDQVRHRQVRTAASCGGNSCVGQISESRTCNANCCPVNCAWKPWQEWGQCTTTCGGGSQSRSRSFAIAPTCGGGECAGVASEERTCNEDCCPVDCSWDSWSDWGSCTATCGGGSQSRKRGESVARYCGGNACKGNAIDKRQCNSQCCPIPCLWSDWKAWSSCSVTCGGGERHRTRSIAQPSSCNGAQCIGKSSEEENCNTQCCPVNCEWEDWTRWGACSKRCEKGTQRRTRGVAIHLQCGGNKCLGNPFEDRFCNDVCCPVHCKWSAWSDWTQCTKECGTGTQSRQREVEIPHSCEGEQCVGEKSESRECNTQCCRVDCIMGAWTSWSECSQTCGAKGTRTRGRSIARPSHCGGLLCSNKLSEEETCNRICFHGGSADRSQCQCADGWEGECCEEDIDECKTVACPLNSKCMNEQGSYDCVCNHGYTKSEGVCLDIDECKLELHKCHELASCINKDGHYVCQCDPGFSGNGTMCADVDECRDYESPDSDLYDYLEKYGNDSMEIMCHDEADCINTHGSYLCECFKGYTGDGVNCQDIDECKEFNQGDSNSANMEEKGLAPCHENANCRNTPGSYWCNCQNGYFGDGQSCKEIDECDSGPCQNGGECIDLLRGFKCHCADGFTGDFCQNDIDECTAGEISAISGSGSGDDNGSGEIITNLTCDEHATCTNTYGSYACTCNWGFVGDGHNCSDLNECKDMEEGSGLETSELFGAGRSRCHENATCFNLIGNYYCKCNRGYRGSGFDCEEIDECASKPCKHGGTCVDGLARFSCLCADGYRGLFCERDINECHDGTHDCDARFGRCINHNGSHSCVCQEGFSGDGKSCTDVDECRARSSHCDKIENSVCANTLGSYMCPCAHGFEKKDERCVDIDECMIGNHDCTGLYQACRNSKGGYICECMSPAVNKDGRCEVPEPIPELPKTKSKYVSSNTWSNIVNALKKPRILAIVVLTAIVLIATVALIIRATRRRPSSVESLSGSQDGTFSMRRASTVTENEAL